MKYAYLQHKTDEGRWYIVRYKKCSSDFVGENKVRVITFYQGILLARGDHDGFHIQRTTHSSSLDFFRNQFYIKRFKTFERLAEKHFEKLL